MAVAEERVRVGDPVVGAREDAQHGLAAAQMRQSEPETVDLELGAGRDELLGIVLVLAAPARTAGQPETVLLGDRPGAAPRMRRPVRGRPPARRRAPRTPRGRGTLPACSRASANARSRWTAPARGRPRSSSPARAARGEPVEVRRIRDLVRSLARRASRAHDRRDRPARRRGSDTPQGG